MHWNRRRSAVRMAKEEVALATSHNLKAQLLKNTDEFLALQAGRRVIRRFAEYLQVQGMDRCDCPLSTAQRLPETRFINVLRFLA
jgi:hypothetical protein